MIASFWTFGLLCAVAEYLSGLHHIKALNLQKADYENNPTYSATLLPDVLGASAANFHQQAITYGEERYPPVETSTVTILPEYNDTGEDLDQYYYSFSDDQDTYCSFINVSCLLMPVIAMNLVCRSHPSALDGAPKYWCMARNFKCAECYCLKLKMK